MGFYFRRVEALDPFRINNSDVIVVNNPFLINNLDVVVVNNPFLINNLGVVVVINPKRIEGRHCLVAPQSNMHATCYGTEDLLPFQGAPGHPPSRLTPHYHADDGRAGDGAEVA